MMFRFDGAFVDSELRAIPGTVLLLHNLLFECQNLEGYQDLYFSLENNWMLSIDNHQKFFYNRKAHLTFSSPTCHFCINHLSEQKSSSGAVGENKPDLFALKLVFW